MFRLPLRSLVSRLFQASPPGRRPAGRRKNVGYRPRLEALEDRALPSTVNWIGGSGDWRDPTHWEDSSDGTNHVPGASDDAVIVVFDVLDGGIVWHTTGTDAVRSVTLLLGSFSLAGGFLDVSGTLSGDALWLDGGTLANATVAAGSSLTCGHFGGTLSGVRIDGTLNMDFASANTYVTNGLTLNGTAYLGNGSGGTAGDLFFQGTQTLDGTGSVVFGGSSGNGVDFRPATTGTLAIGPGITIHGKAGTVGCCGALGSTLVNQGTINADIGGGIIQISPDTWSNSGTVQASNGGKLFAPRIPSNYSTGTRTLTGGTWSVGFGSTLQVTGADIQSNAAKIVLDGADSNFTRAFGQSALQNFGTNASNGDFAIRNGRNLGISGAFSNAGSVTIGSGSTFTTGGNYTQTAGVTMLNLGTLAASPLVSIVAGTLAGMGTINANVSNGALLSIGTATDTGILRINGNYTQTAAATLAVKIGGFTTPGTDFDQLVLGPGYQATLAGTLTVTLTNGYAPLTGDSIKIMTFASATGTFATLTGDGPLFTPNYNPFDVTLVAI